MSINTGLMNEPLIRNHDWLRLWSSITQSLDSTSVKGYWARQHHTARYRQGAEVSKSGWWPNWGRSRGPLPGHLPTWQEDAEKLGAGARGITEKASSHGNPTARHRAPNPDQLIPPPPPRPRSQTQDPPALRHLRLWSRLNPAPQACCRCPTSGNQLSRRPALTFRLPPRRHCACADITSAWGKAPRRSLLRAPSAHAAIWEVVSGDGVQSPLGLGEFLCLGAPAAACGVRRAEEVRWRSCVPVCLRAGGAVFPCVHGRKVAEEMAING